ncbi:UDP-N-acetylmuramoyl-tripeptide--D-alanyl-D-alanine ligase [Thalassobacillus pellis]|uniref:UDP-N-acetylmuramoyl-tripeptide--D-alanyl-D- alanine ligase n=1 Tax=Thalassobacillus pellis TaxID=748008 RepID=UPI0019608405|nr:UDP-N-acetylmuramoyl-tripeptide--D-alanyl-D-alanine ligase [Thalassobacillus pellis]MBM7552854.1 UDP-N-acetylmuramoyl-tripeptide--D-alanyl-D-alanine ligase [Thalassobacillus pellis]
MLFAVNELNDIFSISQGASHEEITIHSVMTDSRKEMKQSIFVPVVGEKFDAHQFMKQAIENGAVAALWQSDRELPKYVPTDFPVFFVEDTTKALQVMAKYYLGKVDPVVIGITGSNGKTTTKDLVSSVVGTRYRTHKTAGNFNNHIGLPLTIFEMPMETEAAVLEMGMSQYGEIEVLSNLARPDYAIITNIGESHIEFLGSREGIAKAKLEIKAGLKKQGGLIFDGDEPLLEAEKDYPGNWPCGMGEDNRVVIKDIEISDESGRFTIDGESYEVPIPGKHNIKNASFAIALARLLNIPKDRIQEGLDDIQVSGMRFERIEGKNGSLIINDAYNASPTSMRATIEIIKNMKSKQKKVLVLGDVYELGELSKEMHRSVADAIDEHIHAVYTCGEDAEEISKAVASRNPSVTTGHYTDKHKLQEVLVNELDNDTVVLLKASRGVKLETLIEHLTEA